MNAGGNEVPEDSILSSLELDISTHVILMLVFISF